MYGMRGDPISDSAAGRRTPDIHGPDPQQLVKIAARGERYEADGQIASFNVVFASSYRAPGNVTPEIESAFNRTFKIVRVLPCDVPLGDHPAQYNMAAKYSRVKPGAPNPFIDPANCWVEAEIQEAMLRAQIQLQRKRAQP